MSLCDILKTVIRWLLWPFAVVTGGEWEAKPETLKFHFLNWLYGNGEAIDDGWDYPE